jgi:hypothetical protein
MTKLTLPNKGEGDPRFRLFPEGSYRVRIWSAVEKLSSQNNPMVEVQYKILDAGFENWRTLYDYFSLLPDALWKLGQLFEVLGMQSEGDVDVNWQDDLVGKTLVISVKHEARKKGPRAGQMRENVESYRSLDDQETDMSLGGPPVGDDDVPF